MSSQDAIQESQQNLIAALESGLLSEALMAQGQDILTRMQNVLRLSVIGLPESGKSTLMNLLLGTEVIPDGLYLPTMAFHYGETTIAKCTLPTGEVTTLHDTDLHEVAKLQAVYVDITMPLPALRKLSMMEVVVGSDPTEQRRAVKWASKRTDIALWCTQYSYPAEESLWELLPDRLLDHAFLMVTKTDELEEDGALSKYTDRAHELGSEMFYQVLPIDALTAVNARKPDGTVDKQALRESGGMALISAILREVQTGERAAADAADVFLHQVNFDPTTVARKDITPAKSEPKAVTKEAAFEPVSEDEKPSDTPAKDASDVVTDRKKKAPAHLSEDARVACAQVIDQLVAEGNALTFQLENGEISQTSVVDVTVDTITWVADYLEEATAANDETMQRTCETAHDAADLVQLIKLEKGETVAADALSLLIQLKHEIQAELVA